MVGDNLEQMNQEALTKVLIVVLFLVVVLVGTTTGHASVQQQFKPKGTAVSNSRILTGSSANSNNTSNSTSSNLKQVTPSNENASQKLTKSMSASIKPLSVSIKSSQTIFNGRGKLTISALAYDTTTGKKIENALVRLKILFTSNDTSKEIVSHNGEVIYSAEIKPDSKGNANIGIRTTAQASAPGYISTTKTSLSSSSTSITSSNSSSSNTSSQAIIKNNASSNLAQKILRDVQKRLEQNGIHFSLDK